MAAGTKGSAAVSLTEPRLRGSIKPGSTEKLSGGGAPNCGATFGTDRTINCRSAMPRARLDRAITKIGRAHVNSTTNAHLVCRLLVDKKKQHNDDKQKQNPTRHQREADEPQRNQTRHLQP